MSTLAVPFPAIHWLLHQVRLAKHSKDADNSVATASVRKPANTADNLSLTVKQRVPRCGPHCLSDPLFLMDSLVRNTAVDAIVQLQSPATGAVRVAVKPGTTPVQETITLTRTIIAHPALRFSVPMDVRKHPPCVEGDCGLQRIYWHPRGLKAR